MSRALLLTGSPKPRKSSSAAIAAFLAKELGARGWTVGTAHARAGRGTAAERSVLAEAVREADLLVLVFPLYYDSLPAILVEVLENLPAGTGARRVAAVCQCGFPEAAQCRPALEICRQFAGETGREWCGGLSFGMGGSLGGQDLERLGGRTKRLRRALALAAEALARGDRVPAEAEALAARPMMPRWLYLLVGNWGWKRHAKKRGTAGLLNRRPYA